MEFLRYLFLLLVIAGSTSVGFLLSKGFSDRVKELRELANLINILQNKIKFTQVPLKEALTEISNIETNSQISKVFLKAGEKIKDEKSEVAWQEALNEERIFLNLKNEDIELIKSLGNTLGKTDIEGQMSGINQFENILNMQIKKAEEECSKNSKMYKSLGTIIGLTIVIILF